MIITITNIITQRVVTTASSSTCRSVVPPQRAVALISAQYLVYIYKDSYANYLVYSNKFYISMVTTLGSAGASWTTIPRDIGQIQLSQETVNNKIQ